jgi:hypothetical protein
MSDPGQFGGGNLPGRKTDGKKPLSKQNFHGGKRPAQPGNDIVVTATVELLGVGLLTLLAGVNRQLGSIVVIIMVGFLLGWLLINSQRLKGWLEKA